MSNEAFVEPDFKALFEGIPSLYMVLDPNLRIVATSDAYLKATRTRRSDIIGRYVFEVFPDNPDDPNADAVRNSLVSFNRVLQTRKADAMVVQRHDIRRPESEGGGFEIRYWSPVNSPLLNPDGTLAYIIHRVEDVTEFVRLKEQGVDQARLTDTLREQAVKLEADLYARSREVAETSLQIKQANEELARHHELLEEQVKERTARLESANVQLQAEIAERKRAEEELRYHANLVDNVSDAIISTDRELKIRSWNKAAERMYGWQADEVIGLMGSDVLRTTFPEGLSREDVARDIFEKGGWEGELIQRTKDGRDITVQARSMALKDEAGNVIGGVSISHDITERKRSEEALRESEARYSTLFNTMTEGFALQEIVYDESGVPVDLRFLDMNPAFEQLTGLKRANVIGRLRNEVLAVPDPFWLEKYSKVVLTGEPAHFENYSKAVNRYYAAHAFRTEPRRFGVIFNDITERKLTEAALQEAKEELEVTAEELRLQNEELVSAQSALQESEARLRRLYESGLIGVIYWNMDGMITDANDKFLEMVGYTREELAAGRIDWVNMTPLEYRHLDENSAIELKATGVNEKPFEKEYIRKDGTRIPIIVAGAMLDEARFNGVAFVLDITERKRAEGALRESEERFRLVLRNAPVSVAAQDRDLRYIWAYNQRTAQPEEIIGKLDADIFTPAEAEHLTEIKRRVLEEMVEVREQMWLDRPGGRMFLDVFFEPIHDEAGRAVGVGTATVDLTQMKIAEEKIEHLASFPQLNPNPVLELDSSGRVSFANSATSKILGELGTDSISAILPEDMDVILNTLRNGEEKTFQREVKVKDRIYGEAIYLPKKLDVTRIYAQDITERKRAEEALREAKDKLELRVQERTAELSSAKEELEVINEELQVELEQHRKLEADLIKAKEAAEVAAKAKAEFLANMSHEIRTPMNAVIGMTGLMLEEPLTPEQRDNLELIRTNGDALMTIINDILDFSKIESDKVTLEEQPFNLRALVEESLDLVAIRAAEKGLNLAYTINKNVPDTIISDPTRLRQVLGNLLSNAVKFTNEGEVKISVSVDGTNEVHFAVQDTGIGIPPDHMNLLFQPFSQMEPSTTRLYGGTGLGLAISKKLVEMMSGRIWAESEPGIGSTFHFTIKASSSESEPKPDGVLPEMVGKNVLIVSDNKTNRSILGKQVYSWGMIPMIALSSTEALNWVRRGDDFDIVILDVDMPDMDGLALEKEIRKYNKALPLVLLTSLGKRVPPDHTYLTKPIKPSQLYRVLTETLSRQSTQKLHQATAASRSVQINPLRILLAEDNVSSQKIALQMLKRLGYKADVAANGIEVLHALERQHYDVVLMDLRMPEMDGLEATRIIRQRWPEGGPKVIAITAYAIEGDREKSLEAGMDDYIAKPVKIDELAAMLSRYQAFQDSSR